MEWLRDVGFSPRWVALQTDLWLLVFVTYPDAAAVMFADQADILADPALRELFLAYDRAHDLPPHDPSLPDLAQRIIAATTARYGDDDLPSIDVAVEVRGLIEGAVDSSSPAWQRLDTLIRAGVDN